MMSPLPPIIINGVVFALSSGEYRSGGTAMTAAQRAQRLRTGLAQSGSVTNAMYDAGFNSSGHFYAESSGRLGMTPSAYRARRAVAEPPVETPPVVAADADEKIPTLPK